MVELRDCVQKLIGQQIDGFISDDAIRQTQRELNDLYDTFTAKHGLINSRGNALAFADDSSYYLLCSLEVLNEDNNLKGKADMFTKRTIKPSEVVISVNTASEALAVSIAEKARVDMEYMSSITGNTEEELANGFAWRYLYGFQQKTGWLLAYRKSGYSKKFLEEHEDDIIVHKTAKKAFNELGMKKLPTVKSLQVEFAEQLTAKKEAYAELKKVRDELRDLTVHKANYEELRDLEEREKRKEKEHGRE